jgi:lysophospholipase L1-like esterase
MSRRVALLVFACTVVCTPTPPPPAPVIVDPETSFAVAAYGDSLTANGGGVPGWPSHLPQPAWTAYNGGNPNEAGMEGASRPLNQIQTLVDGYDVVVLWWGTNDVWNRFLDDLTPEHLRPGLIANPGSAIEHDELVDRLGDAIETLRAAGLPVVQVWPPPPLFEPADPMTEQERGAIRLGRLLPDMRARAESHGARFVDLYTEFDQIETPGAYYRDSVHLNELGAMLAAALIEAEIRDLLPAAP